MTKQNKGFYPIQDDWRQLSSKYKNKIDAGVVIAGEQVISYTTADEFPEIFAKCVEDLRIKGHFFIPQFETTNFEQGLMYKPVVDASIDKTYNRDFYKDHFAKLFQNGYDPTLAGVADILVDLRNNLIVNWDSRHRTVGYISASTGGQVPPNQWCNCVRIKKTAPQIISPEKLACDYFRKKNQTPKALSPEERFIADYKSEETNAVRAYTMLLVSGLRLDSDKLQELHQHKDARIITGITHFQTHWEKQDLGKGRFLPKVVDSIREIWSYAQCQSFSVYFIFGYAYLLRLDDVCGDQFGFDNQVMIDALKYHYEKNLQKQNHYISPKASNKAIESVAFLLARAYNRYIESENLDHRLLDIHNAQFIDLPRDFLSQIGEPIPETEDTSSIDEALDFVTTN